MFILADDMGYESMSEHNDKFKLPLPSISRLMAEGMDFTDAHSGSSVCSPTRYGLLTGRHSWRSRLKKSVVWSGEPSLIRPERLTVAEMLQERGYHTACFGKWHLGMEWFDKNGRSVAKAAGFDDHSFSAQFKHRPLRSMDWSRVDFTQPFRGGPVDHGFDLYYGDGNISGAPHAWHENDRVPVPPPSGEKSHAPDWSEEQVLPAITRKAVAYIHARAEAQQKDAAQPFFLYFPLTSPHTPIVPTKDFQDKSGMTLYADFLLETDWAIGEVLRALDQTHLAENTLVIFTADNGTSGTCKFFVQEKSGLFLKNKLRAHKASIYEGGHRVPYVVRWPGVTPPGSRCDEPVCLTDFMATMADLTGYTLPDNAAEDSHSLLSIYQGNTREIDPPMVHHSATGAFAIREGDWKLVFDWGFGQSTFEPPELYNLREDIGENNNVITQHPEKAAILTAMLSDLIHQGRSTPGEPQPNEQAPDWQIPVERK